MTLRGGALTLLGRPQVETTETLGALTLAPGLSTITANASNGVAAIGVYSAEITFASLASRQAGSMVNFVGLTNGAAAPLGLIGSNPRVLFTAAPTLNSNLIGGWAVVTNPSAVPEFASYVPTVGVGALGANGFPAYDATTLPVIDQPTQNIRIPAAAGNQVSANRTINSLNLVGFGLTFTGDSLLSLTSGGLIHSGASVSIGATAIGLRGQLTAGTTAAPSELLVYNGANTLTINSKIVNNPATGPVSLVLSGSGTIALASQTSNTFTGGTTVNNGVTASTTGAATSVVVFPSGGLTLNGATVTTTAVGQIATTNNLVTLNGLSTLNLVGDNSLSGISFNNTGGTSGTNNPVVNSGGTLTLSAGNTGISATSSNVTTTATLGGRFSLPSGTTTFAVDPILFNGAQVAPTQAALATQGLVGTGGITKTGAGVLQFNAQAVFTGQVNVQAGSIQFGVGNGGSRFSNMNLAVAGTRINLNGQSGNIGSLSGATGSVVTNASPTGATLTMGFDGSPTTFAGRFARFGDGIANTLNITKIGAGTLDLTGAGSDSTATLSVQGGTVRYSGPASTSFAANNVLTGGTLTLDNAVTNVNSRLGGTNANAITLTTQGGTVKFIGNAGADTTEIADVFTVGSGSGVLDLQPNAARKLKILVSTTFTGIQAGGTLFIKNLPTLPDAYYSPSNGETTIDLGLIALNAPAGAGSGFPATDAAIRPDIVASIAPGLPATAFVTKDLFTNLLRPLASAPQVDSADAEVSQSLASGSLSPTNYDLATVASISENTTANSIVLQDTAKVMNTVSPAHGLYGPNATLLTQTVVSGGILAVEGGASSINVGLLTTGTNVPLTFHGYGDLAVTANVGAGTGGLTKSGTGAMTVAGRGFYTGVTAVNGGSLTWNGPQENNIAVVPATTTSLTSALTVNGGMFDLGNHGQVFGTISSINPNSGAGGEITNTGASMVTLTSSTGTSSSFGGTISNTINLVKTGNSTLTLTSPNTYTGTTTIRGGGISLRDKGTLSGTSSVEVIYGALTIDQTQLNPLVDLNPLRLPQTVPITLHGGTLTYTAGGSMAGAAAFDDITVEAGANVITAGVTQNAGSTATVTIGNLTRVPDTFGTVNFNAGGGTLANTGLNNPHLLLSTLDGNPITTVNDLIGAWAVVTGSDFASARTSGGGFEIGAVGNTGAGFNAYGSTDITTATALQNVNDGANRTLTASKTINTLRVAPNAANTLTLNSGVVLTLGAGGLLTNNNNTYQIIPESGAAVIPQITAGSGADGNLYLFINQNTTTIGAKITNGVDSPLGLNVIKSGGGALTLTAANSYLGTTIVNQGTLTLNLTNPTPTGLAGAVAIPGDLMINNATTTLNLAKQLRTTAKVTIDGSGVLNMVGSNTISRVVFNNRGGNAAPIIQPAPVTAPAPLSVSNLVFTAGGVTPSITATNDVYSTTPTVAGTSLILTNAQPVISTSGMAVTSLLVTAPIHDSVGSDFFGGALVKTGPGSLALNPSVGVTGNTTSGSNLLTGISTTLGLAVGMNITGTNIPAGTTIEAFVGGPGGTALQLSTNATGTATNTMTLSGSTFTKGVKVNQGSLILGSSSVLDPSLPLTPTILNGPVGTGTLTLADGSAIMSDGTLRTLHNAVSVLGSFLFGPPSASNATALAGNGVNLAGAVALVGAGDHTISVADPLNISTISGLISGANSTLIKAGSGTLVLAQSGNTWGTSLSVTEGVLRSAVAGAVPTGINLSVATGGVFDSPGVNQVVRTLTGGGAVTNSSTGFAATLYVGGTSTSDTTTDPNPGGENIFAGSISGIVGDNAGTPPARLSLTKVGAGTFTLSGANTYRGATNVNSGTLRVDTTGSLRIASDFTVLNGATAEINGSIFADSGTVQTSGLNSRIRGSGTIGGNVTIDTDGILQPVRNGTAVLTINNGGTLLLQADATVLYRVDAGGVNGNRIQITDGNISLPSSGFWKLKLENTTVVNPSGLTFVLFDGPAGGDLLNGNTGSGSDNVGNPAPIDFGTTGWSFNMALPEGLRGIHYDFDNNDIVLLGVVPEPGTGSLVAGCLAVALGLQRFRRRRSVA
ncbi:MAG: autotransporter-associated beta strand repeat-containing protein [Chthoniobacteraceae bacterium]